MEFESYSSFWNHQAATPEGALAGVDGSANEETVRMTGAWAARQVRAALALNGTQRVLELGCGVGRIGRELAGDFAHWHGVDISRSMLDVAASRLEDIPDTDFSLLERAELPMIESGSLDCAYSVAVLCHMDKEDLYLYLQDLHRSVRSGGLIYVETWNLAHPMGWRRWQFEVDNWSRADQSRRKHVSRNQFCVPEEFQLYLAQAGWQVARCWSDSPWVQAVAMKSPAAGDLELLQARLDRQSDEIRYSAQFSDLFGDLLDVIYGVTPPGEMDAALAQAPETPETRLFRSYLHALWRQGEAHWGPAPGARAQ